MTGFKKFSGWFGVCLCVIAAVFFACEKVPEHCGDGSAFDSKTQFCFDGKTYDKCGGDEYNPVNLGCDGGVLKTKCGGVYFDPPSESCIDDVVHYRCGDDIFVPSGTPCATYILTTIAIPDDGGSVTRDPDELAYDAGASVTVTAAAVDGYRFVGWSGALTSTTPNVVITMNQNQMLTANFEILTYLLTVDSGNGGTVSPLGTSTHYAGAQVTVTATPNSGYAFTQWTGAALPTGINSTDASVTFNMSGNVSMTANFHEISTFTVTAGSGGSTDPSGIMTHNRQDVVRISATPDQGCTFAGWRGDLSSLSSTANPVSITIQGNWMISAVFSCSGDEGDHFNPNINYDFFTDSRDGKTYRTVKIGDQTWMAQNLNWAGDDGNLGVCYRDNPNNCAFYGRLYEWPTVMNGESSSSLTPSGVQGICPDGWHVPSEREWAILTSFVGNNSGTKLRSAIGWVDDGHEFIPGTDDFGFSAIAGGFGFLGGFGYVGYDGSWWSATETNTETIARLRTINLTSTNLNNSFYDKRGVFSLRCVRD
ncbi:MAG: InlB B-repeat-containing protein [Chitinispirillales bacterium]|jgi:uncharacterized protein (TIGR02145 family)/uncharacterized repeat protein (TIGR02543 family)|nr:InlB B-repeat-containing protein [Chitinispirillales bacterium]